MQIKISFIILAAGNGTRMRSRKLKVMHHIANFPLIHHVINNLADFSNSEKILVINNDSESLKNYSDTNFSDIKIAIQDEQLGTANAVKDACPQISDDSDVSIIIYGDSPFISSNTIKKMIKTLEHNEACVLGFEYKELNNYGKLITENNELHAIIEAKELGDENDKYTLCNSGIIAVKSNHLEEYLNKIDNNNSKGEYYLTDIVKIIRDTGKKVSYIETDYNEVLGINNKEELAMADKIFQQKFLQKLMEQGVEIQKPDSIFISADFECGKEVTIEPFSYIGKGVKLGDEVTIKAFSHIENCTIDSGTNIGPYARIRGVTSIGKNAKIGNFVEVKNSQIEDYSKVSHLSYIGDSEIGEDVNIGAGTITCNYDGFNKHKTTIEDSASIGANTSLIAPVTIGKDSIVAAGSVITKSVPENALAVERSSQSNFEEKALELKKRKKDK